MLNFKLAKEIYGTTPWLMDAHSIPLMTSILQDLRKGVKLEIPEQQLNSIEIFDTKNEVRYIREKWQLNNDSDFEGVALVNLDGPITKHGGLSSKGTIQMASTMRSLARDARIKSFIILADSGGGSSSAVEIMVDAINEVKQNKPVFALVNKGGMACSACYGIISAADEIYAEDKMSIIGSVGTMIQFEGYAANSKSKNGKKHIRLYATKSTKKNQGFEEALNNDNYKVLVNTLLDPINENFINMVLSNRPKIKNTDFDNGITHFAHESIGTYIDGLSSFAEVVSMSLNYKKSKKPKAEKSPQNSNINKVNSKTMTRAELLANHPELYNSVFAEGVAAEKDRAGAWLAHVNTDTDAVVAGIESGNNISQTDREKLLVKQSSQKTKETIIDESAKDLQALDTNGKKKEELTEAEKEAEEAFNFSLK